jgi:hypothetical protein
MRALRVPGPWARAIFAAFLAGSVSLAGAVGAQQPAGSTSAPASESARGLPKDLPLKREPPSQAEGPSWAALLMLLALAGGGAALVLRRRRPAGWLRPWRAARSGSGLERIASQSLTQQASVHAVRWQGEELLLGCTGTEVTVLSRRQAGDEGGGAA